MVRITLSHINMHGPLQFPAKKVQIFVEDKNVPKEKRGAFYQTLVDNWLKANPDRQRFGDYEKDIVDNSAIPRGDRIYIPSDDALGKTKPAVTEEEI